MKSEEIVLEDKRAKIRVVEVKSESEEAGKILGLFEENREEEKYFLRTNSCKSVTSFQNALNFLLILSYM